MSRRKSIGVFTTDTALVVQSWDPWMSSVTGISEFAACGQPLASLYPELVQRGLIGRLRRVAEGAGVEVLAPAFHKYLIPCAPREVTSRLERMRQHVTVAPLRDRDGIVGIIVTIEDVTARFERERRLAADLDSDDETTRLRAAETLAAAGEAPLLLAGSLSDDSWRVRRAAAEGLADGGGAEVIGTLVKALREHHRDPALLNAALTALARTRDDVVGAVLSLLDEPDAEVRTYAALALGLLNDPRAVRPLIERLADVDTNVRFHAIEALGRLRDSDATDALVAIALTRDFFVSFAALDALALIGEPSAVPALTPLLDDPSLASAVASCLGALATEDVAVPIARLIDQPNAPVKELAGALVAIYERMEAQTGDGALVADLARSAMSPDSARALEAAAERSTGEERAGIIRVLSWLPFEGVIERLVEYLSESETRQVAAEGLTSRGVAAAALLIERGPSPLAEVRRIAAEVLGRIGSPMATSTLVQLLDDRPEVIVAAAGALGAIGDREAFAPLLAVMDHEEASVRQAIVSALNSIGHPRMEEAVSGRLTDPSPRVREAAARIAGYFGYASCLRRVVDLCDDEDEMVRRAAVEHLASYDQRPAWSKIHETLRTDERPSVRAAAARALGQSNTPEAIQALIGATGDRNLWVRYFAVRSLGRLGLASASVLTCLAECATRDDTPPVRIAAIEALAELGASSMSGVLLGLAHDADVDVACAAMAAIPATTSTGAEALSFALESREPRRILAAIASLGRQRAADAVPTIAAMAVESRDEMLRTRAVQALGQIGTPAAIKALLGLSSDRMLREAVITALAELGAAETPLLRPHLEEGNEGSRRLIVEALSRTRNASAAGVLAAALDDASPSVRLAAARALGRLDVRDARVRLASLATTDENPAVRIAASDALSR